MLRTSFAIVLFLPLSAAAQDQPEIAKYMLAKPGTVPIILSAPHGGRTTIPGIPERVGNGITKFVTVVDTNTGELAEKLAVAIEKELGGRPFLVVAKFERKQIDPNRPAKDAYENEKAKPHYDAYHAALKEYTTTVQKTWGRGLLIDVHGQAAQADAIFRGTQNLKTVAALKDRFGLKAINGPNSVLGVLAKKGYTVIPGPDAPADEKENPKFNGGYIVVTYGSDAGTGIDALQLEFGGDSRAKKALDQTATDVASAIKAFHGAYLPAEKLPGK